MKESSTKSVHYYTRQELHLVSTFCLMNATAYCTITQGGLPCCCFSYVLTKHESLLVMYIIERIQGTSFNLHCFASCTVNFDES
jgi:hypothetical protein